MDISSLHSDVLLRIFRAVADNEPSCFMSVPYLMHYAVWEASGLQIKTHIERLGWIRLGHVNHLWRVTLMSAQILWAEQIGSLPAGFEEMLARAGPTAPLILRLPIGHEADLPIVNHLTQLLLDRRDDIISRLRGIVVWDAHPMPEWCGATRATLSRNRDNEIYNFVYTLMQPLMAVWEDRTQRLFPFSILISSFFEIELPRLEVLDLSRPSFASEVISIAAPNLHCLRLKNCFVLCPRSPQLVTISLTRTVPELDDDSWDHGLNLKVSVGELLSFLRFSAESLQYLELNGVFIHKDNDTTIPDHEYSALFNPVDLRSLRNISMDDLSLRTALLLSLLRYPQSATTSLKGSVYPPGLRHRNADQTIQEALAKYPDIHAVGFRIYHEPGRPGTIDLYRLPAYTTQDAHICAWYRRCSPFISIIMNPASMGSRLTSIVHSLKKAAHTYGVVIEAVAFCLGEPSPMGITKKLFEFIPCAQSICIEIQADNSSITTTMDNLCAYITKVPACTTLCLPTSSMGRADVLELEAIAHQFKRQRLDWMDLHIDQEFENALGRGKMLTFMENFELMFRNVELRNCSE